VIRNSLRFGGNFFRGRNVWCYRGGSELENEEKDTCKYGHPNQEVDAHLRPRLSLHL
jgi:hypothetical protein